MKVIITTSVFASGATNIQLSAIAHWALIGRHRVLVEDDQAPDFLGWLDALGDFGREEWATVISNSYRLEAREPARNTVVVAPIERSDWQSDPPTISLRDSGIILARPVRVLIEDAVSDRAFILKMATDEQRMALESLEDAGGLIFDHGGGISAMPRRLDTAAKEQQACWMWNWAIFDSDAMQPGQPSQQSEMLRQKCIEHNVPYHQLSRRNIENYLTKSALRGWAFERRRERQRVFTALMSLDDVQRYHYNFKGGFEADENRPAPGAGGLYDGISQQDRMALGKGLGRDIGSLYTKPHITEEDLRRDGSWAEMNPVVANLLASLR